MLQRLNDRTWPVGTNLPHEVQLAEEFQVSRGTVRRALESLVDAGLVERRRKAGTRVVERRAYASTLTIPIVRDEIEQAGYRYGYKLLFSQMGGSDLDTQGLFGEAPLRWVKCLHLRDGRPYQYEDRLINVDTIPEAAEQSFVELSPNEWLVAHVPYSAVRTVLRADLAGGEDIRYLQLRAGDVIFVVERYTALGKQPLTFVRLRHPGHTFQIVTEVDTSC